MAGELIHADPGPNLSHTEFVDGLHLIDGGVNGDLLYYNGTAIVRLAIGAAGTVLTSNGTVPSWGSVGSGAFPLLAPNGSEGAPSYSFSTGATSGYWWNGSRLIVSVGGTGIMQIGTDALQLRAVQPIAWSSGVYNAAADLALYRDAANVLAQRNGTTAQNLRIYNTYTDASNYERAIIGWSANVMYLVADSAGTGTPRGLAVGTSGTASLLLYTNSANRWGVDSNGHFLAISDNTYDIGASGASRPRAIYMSGTLFLQNTQSRIVPGATDFAINNNASTANNFYVLNAGSVRIRSTASFGWSATDDAGGAADVFLYRDAANTLAQRNGTTAQVFRIYNTFTDASNYERGEVRWSGGDFHIGSFNAGTGTARRMLFLTGGAGRWYLDGANGHFLAETDNLYNIGASGANRPRLIYASLHIVPPNGTAGAPGIITRDTTNDGIYSRASGAISFSSAGVGYVELVGSSWYLASNVDLGWNSGVIGSAADLKLFRDAANVLAQRNGTNAQAFNVYNTYTDASNFETGRLIWSGNSLHLGTNQAGTGSVRALIFQTGGTNRWSVDTLGHFIASADNTYDIGASGSNRPRDIYNAGKIRMVNNQDIQFRNNAGTLWRSAMFFSASDVLTIANDSDPVQFAGSSGRVGFSNGRFVEVGGSANRATTNPTNAINIFNGTAPSGTLTNGATFYAAAGEMWVMDAGGTATQLSPHDPQGYWWFNSHRGNKKLEIDVEKILRYVDQKYRLGMVRELAFAGS